MLVLINNTDLGVSLIYKLQTLTVLMLLPGLGRNAVEPYTSLHSLRLAVMLISWIGFSVMLVLYIIVPVCRQETL